MKHDYQRRFSEVRPQIRIAAPMPVPESHPPSAQLDEEAAATETAPAFSGALTSTSLPATFEGIANERPVLRSYKSHFKQRYLVDAAWRAGGHNVSRNITQDGGVVTSLHLTSKYIIVALDNAKIHVFDTEGNALRTLQGHVMGVWAMVPWDDILVSGGCDRDVRVWDLSTGYV